MTDTRAPDVGEVWHRTGGKERVRIGRVWRGAFMGTEDDYIRCHPLNGGKHWVAPLSEFLTRFELGQASTTSEGSDS